MVAWALAASLALAVSAMTGPAALAHDDTGRLTLLEVQDAEAGLEVTVELRYSEDGHPAVGAAVTVAGDGPEGAVLQPVVLEPTDEDGVYRGAVDLADEGEWELRISSLRPVAQLTHTEIVGGAVEPVEDHGADATTTDAAAGTAPPAADPAVTTVEQVQSDDPPDAGTGAVGAEAASSGLPVVVPAVGVLLALGLGVLLLVRTLRRGAGSVRSARAGNARSAGR
ncbi:hypothetical protein GCM10011509_00990 [Ornithinimicrobium pekingense]|uniref:YtkA-like domain-containing protein n=1 Tax=Ornithinimicrobium pekingense TaxID=384677 RepID=A0ABQ2F2R5_9MICO|nr:hypothetical protein GCM10011509_00990 [Ornithinimicrobium pekingense]